MFNLLSAVPVEEIAPHILEALMIVCFGLSWPMSIIKAYKARTAKGTSIFFMSFIELGYVCGIISKLIENDWSPVRILAFVFYIINLVMVGIGICLYIRNRHLDAVRAKAEEQK